MMVSNIVSNKINNLIKTFRTITNGAGTNGKGTNGTPAVDISKGTGKSTYNSSQRITYAPQYEQLKNHTSMQGSIHQNGGNQNSGNQTIGNQNVNKQPLPSAVDTGRDYMKMRTVRPEEIVDAVMNMSPSIVPNPKMTVYGRYSSRRAGSMDWNDPEFDLREIAMCFATESLFRRTVDKYVELIWRNGYKLIGDNKDAIDYVKRRFSEMSLVTGTPIEVLLRSMSQQVVTYSNCFVEKVRSRRSSTGRVRKTFYGKSLDPVAGYFVVDATSMKIAQDVHGRVIKYQQYIETSTVNPPPEWDKEDIIHIFKDREAGLLFGTPMSAPVLGDIKALRLIEENVEILVFNNSIPLSMYLVGDANNKPMPGEIEAIKSKVRNMSTESMLVMPYYHKVESIGFEGRALRCEGYLEYFKNRVLAGLGTSEVALGYSGSAGRQAAETIEKGMYNTVREFQNIIRINVEDQIINELLLEGGFKIDDSNRVKWFFPEIDIGDRIKFENHVINAYSGGLYTENESREEIGREPFTEEQRKNTHFEIIEKPRALMLAGDEPFLSTYGDPNSITPRGTTGERASKSLDQPQNQYGKKNAPGSTKDNDNTTSKFISNPTVADDANYVVLEDRNNGEGITKASADLLSLLDCEGYASSMVVLYTSVKETIIDAVRTGVFSVAVNGNDNSSGNTTDNTAVISGNMDTLIDISHKNMLNCSRLFIMNSFVRGLENGSYQMGMGINTTNYNFDAVINYLKEMNSTWLSRLMSNVIHTSTEVAANSINDVVGDVINDVSSIFDSNQYRVTVGTRNELQRAYNIGIISAGMALGAGYFSLDNIPLDHDGECSLHSGKDYKITPNIDLNSIPPGYMTHPMCTCTVKLKV
jgi:hypothetical protein